MPSVESRLKRLFWGLLGGLWLIPAVFDGYSVCLAAQPGRCAACHLEGSSPGLARMAWRGPVLGEELSLCPGVVLAKRQLFLTESRLASLGEVLRSHNAEENGPAV